MQYTPPSPLHSPTDKELGGPENKYMFVLVSETAEMRRLRFGCHDDSERQKWVQWMVRATGQKAQPQQADEPDEIGSRIEGVLKSWSVRMCRGVSL